MKVVSKAAGIIVKDKKLLLERSVNKERYNSPGGKINAGETPEEALVREIREEFSMDISEDDLQLMGKFERDHDTEECTRILMHVFFVNKSDFNPKPSSEVREIIWVDYNSSLNLPIGTVFQQDVIPHLHTEGYID